MRCHQNKLVLYSGLLKIRTPKNPDFCVFAKKFLSKKSGLLCFRRTSLVQKIRTFTFSKTGLFLKIRTFGFSQKRTCPKNPDFHQKSLHMQVRILSKPLYLRSGSVLIINPIKLATKMTD